MKVKRKIDRFLGPILGHYFEETGRPARRKTKTPTPHPHRPREFWEITKAGQKAIGLVENSNAVHPGGGIL